MALRDLVNRFFYGSSGKRDYTRDDLPETRLALFVQVLRDGIFLLLRTNLLYALFCLAGVVWTYVNWMAATASAAVAGADAVARSVDGYLFLYLAGMVPLRALEGVGAVGEMAVLRRMAADLPVHVRRDFFAAIRRDWRAGLAAGALGGLVVFLSVEAALFYLRAAAGSVFALLPVAGIGLVLIVLAMMNMLLYALIAGYRMRLRDALKDSAILVIARLPYSALFLLLTAAPPALILALSPGLQTAMGLALWYLLFGSALNGLIYASYANSCFDRYLNPGIPGAPIRQGLREEREHV